VTPKPGYLTTEFWSTILIDVSAVVSIIWPGHDFSDQVQTLAIAAAAVATAAYSISRGFVKRRG
jgi:drug/metabolite transporter (DMT)-like permease